jgi:hypothetical protein
MTAARWPAIGLAVLLAGCAAPSPQYGEVVSMRVGDAAQASGFPAPGTVWRLDEADLKVLSPAPAVEPPPPPQLPPPPRPDDPPRSYYYPSPYSYGPYLFGSPWYGWGPGFHFHYWRRR